MSTVSNPDLQGLKLIKPNLFEDNRGFFFESFNQKNFNNIIGNQDYIFVQDNHSKSRKGVLRGLHYQLNCPQGKLVRVLSGEIFDVAVDLRRGSSTLGGWYGVNLSSVNHHQLWIPPGFGHGFVVISDTAEVLYKTTEYWIKDDEHAIHWNDPDLSIKWPKFSNFIISPKDDEAISFKKAKLFK
ncbi:dTDP-4-dehydrorhamnose 3,5-epimerase [Pseudomonadota bacterium]|nr:dTDP-4-dehydrorhamnose 3,5-epimerase [Euryarchaeota archaeon]MDC0181039.1 dTDP-4-dehydrorhamnose 3,5-epimerase [Pseudomonadota bacterium]|tara:strand:+ start:29558 stop:30109 length:552 start_codon:yes stop_codon:yes gene_type:complete